MEILNKYHLKPEINEIGILLKNVSEFYQALNHGKDFLRTPHLLTENLEKIKFYKTETREKIEQYLETICECHNILKEFMPIIKYMSDEDFIEFFKYKEIYNQDIDRGLYKEIAIKIFDEMDKAKSTIPSTPQSICTIFNEILHAEKDETCIDIGMGKGRLAIVAGNEKIKGIEINGTRKEIADVMMMISNKKGEIFLADALDGNFEKEDVVLVDPPFGFNINPEVEDRDYLKWGNPMRNSEGHFLSLAIDKAKKRGAIILPQGALFRGGAEAEVRSNIIKDGCIEGVISLPAKILSYTGILVSIVFFRKDKKCDKIFFLDATTSFFRKIRGGVLIDDENLEELINIYKNFKEIEGISKLVSTDEVVKNDGILNVGRYIETIVEKEDPAKLEKEMKEYSKKADEFKRKSDIILEKLINATK